VPASITIVETSGAGARLELLNEAAHLEGS